MRDKIVSRVIELGADLAGIANLKDLMLSPSYQKYEIDPYYDHSRNPIYRSDDALSILIFGISHPRNDPKMDWWDSRPGGTPGNRNLIAIQNKMNKWLSNEIGVEARSLSYRLNQDGIFLKDAAELAGVGIIGKNNILVSPNFGPQIRLRALLLNKLIAPTNELEFSPCENCAAPCLEACPQKAFRSGVYERKYCRIQMKIDEDNAQPHLDDPNDEQIHYCRACELACVAGK